MTPKSHIEFDPKRNRITHLRMVTRDAVYGNAERKQTFGAALRHVTAAR
jgi:hypothetical protein